MDNETFEKVFEQMVDKARETLFKKGKEYASDDDRLHNFKAAGAAQGITPEQALRGMTTKHTVSINDLVWRGGPNVSMETWWEKIGDEFNYLILLMALVQERESQQATDATEEWTDRDLDNNKVAIKQPLIENPEFLRRVRQSLNRPTFDTWDEFYEKYGPNATTEIASVSTADLVILEDQQAPFRKLVLPAVKIHYHGEQI